MGNEEAKLCNTCTSIIVSPAKQKRDIGIAFSTSVSSSAVLSSFLVELCFSGTIRASVMKLGTSIHLVEGS